MSNDRWDTEYLLNHFFPASGNKRPVQPVQRADNPHVKQNPNKIHDDLVREDNERNMHDRHVKAVAEHGRISEQTMRVMQTVAVEPSSIPLTEDTRRLLDQQLEEMDRRREQEAQYEPDHQRHENGYDWDYEM